MVIKTECILDVNVKSAERKKNGHTFSNLNLKMNENQKLIVCCLGIFICYFYYGILQEKM